ncbi:MAG: hypothetical protein JWP79_3077 [Polaromonas sp.]|nr:hypothetical protein [Polaromonas sp.]MDB5845767.1 hypothetical protein [Polaromonas sp.]
MNSYGFSSRRQVAHRRQGLPDPHAHFLQHGALAWVEVQAHGGRLFFNSHNFRLITAASSPRGDAALAG